MPIYHLLSAMKMQPDEMVSEFYNSIELSAEKGGLYSFEFDARNLVGTAPSINFRNEKGEILLKKDTIVTRLGLRKLKDVKKFYCNIDDLKDKYLYRATQCGDAEYEPATILTDRILEKIHDKKIKNFAIVDEND